MDRYSKSQIKGGFSAAEIMVLGKERAQGRKLEIQETKAKIREERIAKEEANQRAQKALAIANEERMARELETKRANDAIAELAAYKKARKLGPEDEG